MNSKTRYWRFERGGFAEHEPSDVGHPSMLFLAPTERPESWIALMPPTNPEDLPAFDEFLDDIANAANELRLTVRSDGGRRVHAFIEIHGTDDGGGGDGLADAGI